MKSQTWIWGLFAGIVLFAVILSAFLYTWQATKPLPEGWAVFGDPQDVLALVIDRDKLWVGGRDGLVALDLKSGARQPDTRKLPDFSFVRALLLEAPGVLWIGHANGLTRLTDTSLTTFTENDGLPDREILSLMRDREGRIWAGTRKGAARREELGWALRSMDYAWRILDEPGGLLDPNVFAMLSDSRGDLWFGHYVAPRGGLSVKTAKGWQHFDIKEGLPHNNVTALYELSDTVVWAATGLIDRGGVAEFIWQPHDHEWLASRFIMKADGLAGEKARSLFLDRTGVMWVGSEYDGVAYLKKNAWHRLGTFDGLSHEEVRAIVEDEAGNLWLGTGAGLTRLDSAARARLP